MQKAWTYVKQANQMQKCSGVKFNGDKKVSSRLQNYKQQKTYNISYCDSVIDLLHVITIQYNMIPPLPHVHYSKNVF